MPVRSLPVRPGTVSYTHLSAGKADFYLVQNVGALMEEEHQNGLAHVLEHMAFHATEHFPEGVPLSLIHIYHHSVS